MDVLQEDIFLIRHVFIGSVVMGEDILEVGEVGMCYGVVCLLNPVPFMATDTLSW